MWLSIYLVIGIAVSCWITFQLEFPRSVIIGHLWVAITLLLGMFWSALGALQVFGKAGKLLGRTILALGSFGYLFLLFFFLLSQTLWGRTLPFFLALKSLTDWQAWMQLFEMESWVMLLLTGFVSLWLGMVIWNRKLLANLTSPISYEIVRNFTMIWLGLSVCGMLFMPQTFLDLTYRSGEPISNVLKPRNAPPKVYPLAAFSKAVSESRIRKNITPLKSFSKKHVVLIIVDALRASHMGIYGYDRPTTPFLAEWYTKGKLQRVDDVFSTCSHSICGVASIMSSRTWSEMGMSNIMLYEVLHNSGYQTQFFLSGNHLPIFYFDHSRKPFIDAYSDGAETKAGEKFDDLPIIDSFANKIIDTAIPGFFYFHLMSTHTYGKDESAYAVYQPATPMDSWEDDPIQRHNLEQIINGYDNGVLQADAYIERIFTRLNEKEILQNSLVIILGDHGEALGEHGHYGHRYFLNDEDMRIPLLIYDSDSIEYPNHNFATHIDVAPTVLDRLGFSIPKSWEGHSLLDSTVKNYSFHQTDELEWLAVLYRDQDDLFKYLVNRQNGDEKLFNLTLDSDERKDLSKIRLDLLVKFRQMAEEKWGIRLTGY